MTRFLYECSIASVSGGILSQKPEFFLSNSAVKVNDSQAYRNMEMTRERISFTFDPRDTLLSFQMGFSFVRAALACAVLERVSGLEPSSETTAQRLLKLFYQAEQGSLGPPFRQPYMSRRGIRLVYSFPWTSTEHKCNAIEIYKSNMERICNIVIEK